MFFFFFIHIFCIQVYKFYTQFIRTKEKRVRHFADLSNTMDIKSQEILNDLVSKKWTFWSETLFPEVYDEDQNLKSVSKEKFIKMWTINTKSIQIKQKKDFFPLVPHIQVMIE